MSSSVTSAPREAFSNTSSEEEITAFQATHPTHTLFYYKSLGYKWDTSVWDTSTSVWDICVQLIGILRDSLPFSK